MDFTFHSTTSPAQWAAWAGRNVAVEDQGLALETEPIVEARDLGFEAVDVTIDRDGAVYALQASGDVYRYDRSGRATNVWENGDGEPVEDPRALALAGTRVFVADGEDADLVLISERENRAIGRIDTGLASPDALVTGGQTLYLLDGGSGAGDGRVATLQRRGVVRTAIHGLEAPRDLAVDPAGNVAVLEMTDEGPRISRYEARFVASPGAFPYRERIEDFDLDAVDDTLVPHCIEAISDQEVIVHGPLAASGEPAMYHYRFAEDGESEGRFDRRRGLDVRCSRLRTGARRQRTRYPTYYGIGAAERRVYAIEETKKYRRNEGTGRFTGTAFRRFDAGSLDTEWHRVTLGFDSLGSNTQVLLRYTATDERRPEGSGVVEIDDVNEHDAADLRDAGIDSLWTLLDADAETIATAAGGATVERARAWRDAALSHLTELTEAWRQVDVSSAPDTLLEDATGRYLHVRLDLVGDADTSPTVASLRAYCPRQSYLRYLPDLYREDRRGEQFLMQFLSTFESSYTGIEEEIEGELTRYFDPQGVPSEYLDWLDGWLGLEAHEDWPESARREFLDRAPELFEKRGTRRGLADYVRLYLDHVPAPDTGWILEWQRRRIRDRAAAGHVSDEVTEDRLEAVDDLAEDPGHHLFVMERQDLDGVEAPAARNPYTQHMPGPRSFALYVGPFLDPAHREAVEDIVAEEKPAHTDGHVVPMRQHVKLEGNSFLGINTTLTPRDFVLGRATLGEDSVLKSKDLL
ncbi:MAG: phage tail protein [Haloarculaceae archaeon]